MKRYLMMRGFETAIVLLLMSAAIYALIGLMPGDPIDLMIAADPHLTPADATRLRALYGLDLPLYERYGNWLAAALGGDLGYSRNFAQPVLTVLPPFLVNTLKIMGLSFALSLGVALPLGVLAALRPYSKIDYAINFLCFAGISVPVFWLALVFIIVFSLWLGVLPPGGISIAVHYDLADELRHLALPVLTLTVANIGHYTRYVRAAMIETLRQDFIRTARAKGASETRVVLRHALRNALSPVVTILALGFGNLFSGALITETMFGYPGMGKLIFDAIMGNDFNLALVALLLATLFTVLGNLAADFIYAWLDPRIALTGRRSTP